MNTDVMILEGYADRLRRERDIALKSVARLEQWRDAAVVDLREMQGLIDGLQSDVQTLLRERELTLLQRDAWETLYNESRAKRDALRIYGCDCVECVADARV